LRGFQLALRWFDSCPAPTPTLLADHPRLSLVDRRIPAKLLDEFPTAPRHDAMTAATDISVGVAFQQID